VSEGAAGYCRGELSEARGLSNQDACGGPNTNIAFHTLIPFYAACEGVYHFRFHADYGYGGFLGIDGVSHSAGDIWGHVFARDVAITEGDHYWESLGFEGCCDGHSEIEIHLPGDAVTDPWRPITSGASSDLEGDCGAATPPPAPPPSGDSTAGCEYSVYGENDDYDTMSMAAGEDFCIQIGGHLASAHSQEDGDAIETLVTGNTAWIGYHDMGFEAGCTDDRHQGIGGNIAAATFVWTDSTPSDYENWAGGEPNDWQDGAAQCDGTGNEDCTETWQSGATWNDANCDGSKAVVCQVCPFTHANNPTSFQYFADGLPKPAAEFQCIIRGGHLASLHSEDDSQLLDDMIDANGGGSTWIGYHDRAAEAGCTDDRHEGIGGLIEAVTFIWTDGTASDYEDWAGGEPNDWQAGQARCDGTGNEDCTEIWRSGQDWNDANCDGTKPYICGFGYAGLPNVRDITTNSVDGDGDCRSDAATTCYTSGVLSTDADLHYYGDRTYIMTDIPEFLDGMNFVRTANDDKRADENDSEFLCFDVDSDATIYVLYDSRANTLPGWLAADYTDQHAQAAIHTDTNMADGFEIYYAEVAAGRVCMGGNGNTGAGSNYIVVVGPAGQQAVGGVDSCNTITVTGAGADEWNGVYVRQIDEDHPADGIAFMMDDTHEIYKWGGAWRFADYGVATYYVANDAGPFDNAVPPEDPSQWGVTAGTAPSPSLSYNCNTGGR
jgi:hypothetical protein